ncbi:hypothetical protein A6A03_06730 [Chloroflexus islandicus]|uniref:MmyB-like transcription regulator ligand binding domain-containing protein n=1 Tax=Chloroflexus islandicus TaxID=1707952 RepID=A0A178MNZ7_9CHLR|nr:hypothetical protein [Chloroflexus islandicus]OAN49747.1 hypothetical protein A6A03_06730 [Chloroflexus islandicus]
MNRQRRPHPDCQAFVETVDELRQRRRNELIRPQRSSSDGREVPKTFTYTQFREVYSSYPALRSGKLKKPPSRDIVMAIADYLECDLAERNRLLISAHHYPIQPYRSGETLATFVRVAREIMQFVPLPAYIINRDWDVLDVNEHLLALAGITRTEYEAIPVEMRNVIQMIFDPRSPVYPLLYLDHEQWRRFAQRNIYGFKVQNAYCEREPWYIERVARWRELPYFSELWENTPIDAYTASTSDAAPPFYRSTIRSATGQIINFRSLFITLSDELYPQVVAWMPVDHASRAAMIDLGIPIPPGWMPGENGAEAGG